MPEKLERDAIHPDSWVCPSCKKKHEAPHWKDHHQKEPNWKDKIGNHDWDKGSDEAYRIVCEVCGDPLITKPESIVYNWCPECEQKREFKDPLMEAPTCCWVCGESLTNNPTPADYCSKCDAKRKGVPAGLFCPHCGWSESDERVLLVRV